MTIPDEDVEDDEAYDDAVVEFDEVMVALLESVGVEIVEGDRARAASRG